MKLTHMIFACLLAASLIASAQGNPFGDSRRSGADYATYSNRLPTVKLTDAEALNLITTIHAVLDSGEIKRADVDAAMVQVFGEERAAEYLRLFDAREAKGQRWSRRENVAMIAALYPIIPGETEDEKSQWLIERAAPCFTPDRWADVVFPYVLERIQEYRDAGGTLDRWPDVLPEPEPEPAPEPEQPHDGIPDGTIWLHTDVSSWPITAELTASVSGGKINFPYDKTRVWPAVDGANANPWVFAKKDGQWYAATFEWLRFGQTSKPTYTVAGDHVKRAPLNGSWEPKSGDRIGIMVSGLARDKKRNVRERSNISWIEWP